MTKRNVIEDDRYLVEFPDFATLHPGHLLQL